MTKNISVNIDTVEYAVDGMDFTIPNVLTARLTNDDGEVLKSYQNRTPVVGKFETHRLHVRTLEFGKRLEIEGAPYAYLFGQNVFTSDNLLYGCVESLKRICKQFDFKPNKAVRARWSGGDIALKRVDLAVNFQMESEHKVKQVLRQIARQLSERGWSLSQCGDSVCWRPRQGKEFSLTFYAKGPQMRRQKRMKSLEQSTHLIQECETILRVELRLRASALRKLGLEKVSSWNNDSASGLFTHYMKKLRFLSVTSGAFSAEELAGLPARLRPVLAAHKAGHDLALIFGTRTLQRHRRDFKRLGIDLRCPNQEAGTVFPLTRVLSRKNVISVSPLWMQQVGLCPVADIDNAIVGAHVWREIKRPAPDAEIKPTGNKRG